MTDIDLNALSSEELKQLQRDVTKAIDSYERRRLKEAKAKVEAAANELGFSLADLIGEKGGRKTISAPKYQHPDNPEVTWTGRGRQPNWIKGAIKDGRSLDEFLIVK
jgi:DNA-binding protein H-NS